MAHPGGQSRIRSTIQKRDAQGAVRHGAEWLVLWSDPDSAKTSAEKMVEASASRARSRLDTSIRAAARAMAADPELAVDVASDEADLPAIRGQADSAALRRRFHDPGIHAQWLPADPGERSLFDLCEQVRSEACGAALFPGVRENLAARQVARLRDAGLLNAHLALLVPISEGLEMVLRDALTGASEPSVTSQGLWMWDRWIRERFTVPLRALSATCQDQGTFAGIAIPFVHALLLAVGTGTEPLQRSRESPSDGQPDPAAATRENPSGPRLQPGASSATTPNEPVMPESRDSNVPASYKIFTTVHDTTVGIADILDAGRLLELRQTLELRRAGLRRSLARLAARFQRRLLARLNRDWSFDLEEGVLDASRLDRVVVNPGFAHAYKQERESEFPDTVVSILIDNSGSMRGKPIEISCLAAELIATALERCGFASEILGFTTREWKGGRSAKDWVRAGKPAEPGRLNDLLQIVYKSANEPMRRARPHLAGMIDSDLLKENIDGEALLWASRRLLNRSEKRKILIVVSDGAPVDQCTLEFNGDRQILDRHLRQTVEEIERGGAVELAAIGVKHDVKRYYRRSLEIGDFEGLGAGLIGMVDKLLFSRPGF
jgi:cobaltochelatase CobT